jgi:hypothetical protein
MSMSGFWKGLGKGLAKVAVGAGKGAKWCSEHPEVIQILTTVAGSKK